MTKASSTSATASTRSSGPGCGHVTSLRRVGSGGVNGGTDSAGRRPASRQRCVAMR
ncbi:hypothetical protein [Pseudonocardia thermophila]|uniref:hypothetical protein n=1 Tax=Pseudonocardia thermophila TaxID=1848 RepID=UPI002E0FCDFD